MAYIDPAGVLAPRNVVTGVQVVHNTGSGGWAVAELEWNGEPAVGIRWNGDESGGVGHPQARGIPVWFIVPHELERVVLHLAEDLREQSGAGLLAGYRQMAEDREREVEAHEWSEGLIGDAGR